MNQYLIVTLVACLMIFAQPAFSGDVITKTVEAVNVDQADLNGKTVQIRGKVVKVNNGIMKRNFLHIQDGTGGQGTNDITITSNQTAAIGDEVTITGKVVLNRDFGFGYNYPILIEESTIEKHN